MLTRRVSAVWRVTRPDEVARVRFPDHVLNRGSSPAPLPQRRVVSIRRVMLAAAGTDCGDTLAGALLAKPTSPGKAGDSLMMRTAETDVIVVAVLPPSASTRMLNGSGRSTEASGQPSNGVPKRGFRQRAPVARRSRPLPP